MRLLRGCVSLIIIISGLGLAGCGGGSAEVRSETKTETSQTLGQELMDLKKAFDMGIISEREYNDSKQKLIERRTSGGKQESGKGN